MGLMAAMLAGGRRQARLVEAFRWNALERRHEPLGRMALSMTPGPGARCFASGIANVKLRINERKELFTSSWTSVCGRRDRPIREKIIGHSMRIFRERFAGRNALQHLRRALLLFHQPPRQHSGGILLHPKIEQRADLLAEIGGVAETREFIALQRISRSRQKKLPRGLGLVVVHWALPKSDGSKLTLR